MRARFKTIGLALAVLTGTTVLASACREPTQVTLDITYGGPCNDIRGVGLIVATDPFVAESRIDTNVFTTSVGKEMCTDGAPARIGTLVVTPNDDTGRSSIIVLASFGNQRVEDCKAKDGYFGCIVARRAFAFVDHTKLTLRISLDPECRNVPCDAVSTCRKGSCVSADVDCSSGTCMTPGDPGDGGFVTVDAPTSPDAFVQGDAPKDGVVGDGPADAPVDSAESGSDAGTCSVRKNISCSYPGGAAPFTCDLPTEGCCWGDGAVVVTPPPPPPPAMGAPKGANPIPDKIPMPVGPGYRCIAATGPTCTTANTSNPPVLCRGTANCAAGEICCARGTGMQVHCTTGACNGNGSGGTGQVCLEACECPSGVCGTAAAVGADPAQTIRYCMP